VLAHDLLQERQAIHARHFNIEGDYIGNLFADTFRATNGSAAVPITSISGSDDNTSLSVWRTTAESSTIKTRIVFVLMSAIVPFANPPNRFQSSQRSSHFPSLGIELNVPAQLASMLDATTENPSERTTSIAASQSAFPPWVSRMQRRSPAARHRRQRA